MDKDTITIRQAAELLGVSTVTVWKRIKKGQIQAQKIGPMYVIDKRGLSDIYQEILPSDEKKIDKAVDKVIKDYGETLKRLGRE